MAAQLAQFSTLESLGSIDSGVKDLASINKPQTEFQALHLLGKSVSGDSSKIYRSGNEVEHEIKFQIPADASYVNVLIKNSSGQVIKEARMNQLKSGENVFSWDGMGDNGSLSSKGEFNVSLQAYGKNDKKIHAQTTFAGKISGVHFGPEGAVLMLGKQSVKLSEVKKIYDSADELKSNISKNLTAKSVQPAGLPGAGNIGDLNLSRELKNKLGNELNEGGIK